MRANLDGVAVFAKVVEAGGFARAGDRLALSRSAVGKTVARLEARLGVRLFHRSTSRLSLTDEGQIYYEHCLVALEELRTGEALLDSGRREVRGKLKITMPVLFGRYCVSPVLLALAREHPALELDLRYSDAVTDLIGERYDLAIRNHKVGDGRGLCSKVIARQTKIVCAAPAYIEQHGAPRDLEDLSRHDALVYWRSDRAFPWTFLSESGAEMEPELRWRLQFDNQEAIVDAAVSGGGIACLPAWLVEGHIQAGRLTCVLKHYSSTCVDTYAVWPTAPYVPMRLKVVVSALQDILLDRHP